MCKEAVAAGEAWIANEGTSKNLADLLTKMLVQIRREILLESSRNDLFVKRFLLNSEGVVSLPRKCYHFLSIEG